MGGKAQVPVPDEKVFGTLNGYSLPCTIDTGAQISAVPIECVNSDQFTGERMTVRAFNDTKAKGDVCNVTFEFDNRKFERVAVAIPGELLRWTPVLQVSLCKGDDLSFLQALGQKKYDMTDEPKCVRPTVQRGHLRQGYMVSSTNVKDRATHRPY